MSGTSENEVVEVTDGTAVDAAIDGIVAGAEGLRHNEGASSSYNWQLLTVNNIWNCSDFLNLILDEFPPENRRPLLKRLRHVTTGVKNGTLKTWRRLTVVRICYHEEYIRFKRNSNKEDHQRGVSIEALLDDLEKKKIFNLKEAPLRNFNISTALLFPLQYYNPLGIQFLEKFGLQIKYIRLQCSRFNQTEESNGFRNLLEYCPALEELILEGHLVVYGKNSNISRRGRDNQPVFQFTNLKRLTINEHKLHNYRKRSINCGHNCYDGDCHKADVNSLTGLLELTVGLKKLTVNCADCCKLVAHSLVSLAWKGNLIKLGSLKMTLAGSRWVQYLLEYVQLVGPPLETIDFNIDVDDISVPLKIVKGCKDYVRYLKLQLNVDLLRDLISLPNFQELSGTTFGALKTLDLSLNFWGEGALGCKLPALTTVKINCRIFKGGWFNILSNCECPSLTYLEVVFEGWTDTHNTFDFGGFQGMPKLETFIFQMNPGNLSDFLSCSLVASYMVTPYKMVNKQFPPDYLENIFQPEYHRLRLEKLTEFCYPAIFSVDSLLVISKWFPNINNLLIGADMESLPVLCRLFKNVKKITLVVRKNVSEKLIESVKNGFAGQLKIERCNN